MSDTELLDVLVSSFDFKRAVDGGSGEMIIRLNRSQPRNYGFGEVLLLPYLQRAFDKGDDLTVDALRKRIRNDWLLEDALNLGPMYKSVLKRLDRDELITLGTKELTSNTLIFEGRNYAKARVTKIRRSYEDIRVACNSNNM